MNFSNLEKQTNFPKFCAEIVELGRRLALWKYRQQESIARAESIFEALKEEIADEA